jgi:putative RecB family exonuclease
MEKTILSLSPSRISDFQQCPQLYKFRAIDKLPERPGIDAVRGSIVHLILEDLYKVEKSQRSFEWATSDIFKYVENLLKEEPNIYCAIDSNIDFPIVGEIEHDKEKIESLISEVKFLLANYFQLEDPSKIEPDSTEELIEHILTDEIHLKGYVDRIDVSPQGWIRINDYKTGKSPKQNFESKVLFQLKFYALVIYKKTGSLAKQLRLMYLKDSNILSYEPTLADLEITEQKIYSIAKQINLSLTENVFNPTTSKLCDYCYFKKICPAFN